MRPSAREVLVGLVALVGVLFGLDKVGGREIAPGPATHFAWSADTANGAPVLILRTDPHGDLVGWIELAIDTPAIAAANYRAQLSTGDPLAVNAGPPASGEVTLDISGPRADGSTLARDPFTWRPGVHLTITRVDRGPVGGVSDWTLFLRDNDSDSAARARWRLIWHITAFFLLIVFLVGSLALMGMRKEDVPVGAPAQPLPTPPALVDAMIDEVRGTPGTDESEMMRGLLRRHRTGQERDQAILAMGGDPRRLADQSLWQRAILALHANIMSYVDEMSSLASRMILKK